ncbi:MAG: hypothetical protein HY815_29515, partial [Candidatus Riflebacteria bacterium]|nr:hypothetical protein [Candidatus Riflebacteria bacterium]
INLTKRPRTGGRLADEQLDRYLEYLPALDRIRKEYKKLKKQGERGGWRGVFLKHYGDKVPANALRQLLLIQDAFGKGRIREIVRKIGQGKALLLVDLTETARDDLLERGLPQPKGVYKPLLECTHLEIVKHIRENGLRQRKLKVKERKVPGWPVLWPDSLVPALRWLMDRWDRIEKAYEAWGTEKGGGGERSGSAGRVSGARRDLTVETLGKMRDRVASLAKWLEETIARESGDGREGAESMSTAKGKAAGKAKSSR